ncbi:MAG: hypothetical protein K0Q79_3429 [Flavipsychrobacter sp.]|nr:hypothetical protein [Flavipsychrobacter sp.]
MKRFLLLSVAVVMAGFLAMQTSCRKSKSHPTKPTPDDYRIMSYTKVKTANILIPLTVTPIISENYRFEYSGNNLSAIFFTSNEQAKVVAGMAHTKAVFIRIADTIFKTFTDLNTGSVKERDTFLVNPAGQIIHAYFPTEVRHFTYFGKLIATEQVIYRDTGTELILNLTYTADQGDHYQRLWNETVTVRLPDSGIAPPLTTPYLWHDTDLTTPIDITWTTFNPLGTPTTVLHANVPGKSDQLSGSNLMFGAVVTGVDKNGVRFRTEVLPPGYTAKEFYEYYDEQANRPGDYKQIESFTTYGINIYQNTHLFWKASSIHNTTKVTYDIDADSKVTRANVTTKDSLTKNIYNSQYAIQWETR